MRIKNWPEMLKEIQGFLEFNPDGTLQDFFKLEDGIRSRYYNLKPDSYVFPNSKKAATRRPKKITPKCYLPHNKYVKRKYDLPKIAHAYEIVQMAGLDPNKMGSSEWRENKKVYTEFIKDAYKQWIDKQAKKIAQKPEKVDEQKIAQKPEKPSVKIPALNRDLVEKTRIESLLKIAEMIATKS